MSLKPALFLDRDGVINFDYGYVYKEDDFHFIPGIFELVRKANQNGYLVIIVTNQAGIGRGYYTEGQFYSLTDWMINRFKGESACIDAVYFCPFHPHHGIEEYRRYSDWRKPAPGMLLQAQQDFNIDLTLSIMIGDKPSDMEAGCAAGVGTLLQITNTSFIATKSCTSIHKLEDAIPYLRVKGP